MGDILAGLSIGIQIIDGVLQVLRLLDQIAHSARHFGADVLTTRTRVAAEAARLEAFSVFLKHKPANGSKTRFEMLPPLTQRAVVGEIRELELLFGRYAAVVERYGVKELMRGYELDVDPDDDVFDKVAREKGVGEAKKVQIKAMLRDCVEWGLYRRKAVAGVVNGLTEWNDKLMNLLLCGLSFGEYFKPSDKDKDDVDEKALSGLRVATGLTLRTLIAESRSPGHDIVDNSITFQPADSDKPLQQIHSPGSIKEKWVYVEFKPYEINPRRPRSSQETLRRARCLANLLRHANTPGAGFHTLRLRCLVQQTRPSPRLVFVFDLPPRLAPEPTTLLDAIQDKDGNNVRPTLGERFKMARSLAEMLFQFHSVGWLHKSIRSENVLLFRDQHTQTTVYPHPYLVGFEFSRDVTDSSTVERDGLLERNIYRHPDRQGPPEDAPGNRFSVLHDIYALGVVLLEVGLWRPVMGYEEWRDCGSADERKSMLEEHAAERLPHYMGRGYTDAVSACLKGEIADEVAGEPSNDVEREKVLLAFWDKVVGGIAAGVHLK